MHVNTPSTDGQQNPCGYFINSGSKFVLLYYALILVVNRRFDHHIAVPSLVVQGHEHDAFAVPLCVTVTSPPVFTKSPASRFRAW